MNYTSTSTFNNDLEGSQRGETELASKFAERGYTVTTTQDKGLFSGYDLAVERDGLNIKIEFKHDLRCSDTGNVAVELFKDVRGNVMRSGLSVTEADLYVYKIGNDANMYGIKVRDLKQYIDRNGERFKYTKGGDGFRSHLVLVPVADFKSVATVLFQTNPN